MKKILLASLLSSLAMVGSVANAETATGNFQATSTLNSTCVLSVPDVSFGNVNILSGTYNQTFGLTVKCSKGVAYSILPDGPTTGHFRKMNGNTEGNTDTIEFMFANVDETKSWYNSPSFALTGTGTGVERVHNLRASINGSASRTARPDTYSATVVATVTY